MRLYIYKIVASHREVDSNGDDTGADTRREDGDDDQDD